MSQTAQLTPEKRKMAFYNGRKTKPELLARSLRALAMILKVGESEARALEIVGEQFKKYEVGRAYTRAAKTMREEGVGFKQAILSEDVFPRTVHELVSAAPTAASIHKNLVQAAKLVSQGQSVKKKLLISLIQPGFMFTMAMGFLFAATAWIIPGFLATFKTLNTETPPLTLIVLNVADVTKYVIGSLIGVGVLIGLFYGLGGRKIRAVQVFTDRMSIRLPLIGSIVQLAATSRLFELLATNLSTGMGEAAALESAGAGAGNEAIAEHCYRHAERMRTEGARLSEFAQTRLLPENAKYMLAAAPSVRQTIEVMSELGPEYRLEADVQLDGFQKTMEPVVNWIVYLIVAVLIIAVIVPMYAMFPALMDMTSTGGGGGVSVPDGTGVAIPGQ
ncbi:type II secretion system F family protein [Leifsonia sp. Leaf264]|uniref:type II secretion system F family protein n=1 Tax=Leifsonia sp. Leaf264 TaxID=1736314 RepID=UPI0006FC5578|nr:type II secretion system F family protein [Leifsonia sp. Leaf264]KQO98903.1 hypothetical protein ASF30_12640 [Leifsonia sp. Leaf264]